MDKLTKLAMRIIAVLVFSLFVGFFSPVAVYADVLPVPVNEALNQAQPGPADFRVVSGNTLRWDAVSGATSYTVWLDANDWWLLQEVSGTSLDLQDAFRINTTLASGQSVRFVIVANFPNGMASSPVSYHWQMHGNQHSGQLTAPTGLSTSGNLLSWHSVTNATQYMVVLNTGSWSRIYFTTRTTANLEDAFAVSSSLASGQVVSLSVFAFAPNFLGSPESQIVSWTNPHHWTPAPGQLSIPTNFWIEDHNILRWSRVDNASTYLISVHVDGHVLTSRSTTDIFMDLNDFIHNHPNTLWRGREVSVSIIARATNWSDSRELFTVWWVSGGGGIPPAHDTRSVRVDASWATFPEISGTGHYRSGNTVIINAGHRAGHDFLGWFVVSPANLILSDFEGRITSFIMPNVDVIVEAVWWRHGTAPPTLPSRLGNVQTPTVNWQNRNLGGVSFNYSSGNFPETLSLVQGSTINFQMRVERHMANFGATFVGQWLRNGTAHGSTFPIVLSSAGFADVELRINSLTSAMTGQYSLRVATIVDGNTTHVDISRAASLSISGQGTATVWPQEPQLPELATVNAIPTTRPPLHHPPIGQTTPSFTAIPSTPSHNHDLVMNGMDIGSSVLQMLPNTNVVRLYGQTLDALVDNGTTLFVVNDIVWVIMPPEFLAHLRDAGGNFIGTNGGTFNITINETHGGATLVTTQIGISTTLNGQTQDITSFVTPYALAIELWDFGMYAANPNHIAVTHQGNRITSHVNPETGVLSLNIMTTGSFQVNYSIN
ncbi:MAG: hypothetical protein FWE34_03710 [Defluviitaleaceae bacterium]|nr:hypothetical protein [Defluviitaleaceae bacterium]